MHIKSFYVVILFATWLMACGPKATPTPTNIFAENQESALSGSSLAPRVLINGKIVGYGDSTYLLPYFVGENLMGDAAFLCQKLHYDLAYDALSQKWTATCKPQNFAGKKTLIFEKDKKEMMAEGNSYTMPMAAVEQNGKLVLPLRFLLQMSGCSIIDWDKDTHSLQSYFYEELDYGIYFYGKQTGNADATGCQKYVTGQENVFFDPSKPTIIYTHGWQLDGVKSKGREDFCLQNGDIDVQTQNFWIDLGWNVGIFHWVQLADDGGVPPPREPEAKIYDTQNKLSQMRWKRANGTFVTATSLVPSKTVRELYADEYQSIFGSNYTGGEIRLVGNSLGGNLTMAMLGELLQRNTTKYPQRVTLIDPYWSSNLTSQQVNFPYNFKNASEMATDAAQKLRSNHNTAIEYFRTSLAGLAGTNASLIAVTAFSHFGTDYSWNTITKHTAPVRQYFWSIAFAPPVEIYRPNAFTVFTTTGNVAASAATPHARILELMCNDKYWNHIEGRNTISPEDDKFEIRNGLY